MKSASASGSSQFGCGKFVLAARLRVLRGNKRNRSFHHGEHRILTGVRRGSRGAVGRKERESLQPDASARDSWARSRTATTAFLNNVSGLENSKLHPSLTFRVSKTENTQLQNERPAAEIWQSLFRHRAAWQDGEKWPPNVQFIPGIVKNRYCHWPAPPLCAYASLAWLSLQADGSATLYFFG